MPELSESELIDKEVTLRNMRLPKEVLETRRSIVRWLALSLGVINPGESRLSSVAVLDALINFQFIKKIDPSVSELAEYITKNWEPINEKTLRYHLLRMKKTGLVENSQGKFYLKPPAVGDKYDAETWASSLYESDYKEIAGKIGEAIKELKSKNTLNVSQ
jgi:DNA-binding transcriptional ArsR family regulator